MGCPGYNVICPVCFVRVKEGEWNGAIDVKPCRRCANGYIDPEFDGWKREVPASAFFAETSLESEREAKIRKDSGWEPKEVPATTSVLLQRALERREKRREQKKQKRLKTLK